MLVLLTFVVMGIVAYSYFREGVLTALTMLVNVFVAGLVAYNFWEPLATELESSFTGSFLEGFEDGVCLFALFTLTLGALRAITFNLAPQDIEMPALVQQVASTAIALLTGYLVAGFLLCLLQTLPLGEKFLGFDMAVDSIPKPRRLVPPDRVWLGLMYRAGTGPLSQADATTFDPEGTFELRYAKLRRIKEQ